MLQYEYWSQDKAESSGMSGGDEYDDEAMWKLLRDHPEKQEDYELTTDEWDAISRHAEELRRDAFNETNGGRFLSHCDSGDREAQKLFYTEHVARVLNDRYDELTDERISAIRSAIDHAYGEGFFGDEQNCRRDIERVIDEALETVG